MPAMGLKASVAPMATDLLGDFRCSPFTHEGTTYDVYRKGRGPAVLVMAEIPGITPTVADFARKVSDRGLTVLMPDLFGVAGAPRSALSIAKVFPRVCVASEFGALALRQTAPIVEWLRALARYAHDQCGFNGVGAVGMCFTGGFALAMATEPEMLAPVMSQPSLPVTFRPGARGDVGCSDEDLLKVMDRCQNDDLKVMGLRFSKDCLSPARRFALLKQVLGPAFIDVKIDSSCRNPSGHSVFSHSVLTEDLIDKPGEPTRVALEQVLDFLVDRLGSSSAT